LKVIHNDSSRESSRNCYSHSSRVSQEIKQEGLQLFLDSSQKMKQKYLRLFPKLFQKNEKQIYKINSIFQKSLNVGKSFGMNNDEGHLQRG
jgi:hypothetical protein